MKKAEDVINSIFKTEIKEEIKKNEIIKSEWNNAAGSEISDHSFVKYIENKILVIEIDHPGWGQIINLNKKIILNKLNSSLKNIEIERFQFKINQQFERTNQEKSPLISERKKINDKSGNQSFDEILENLRKRGN